MATLGYEKLTVSTTALAFASLPTGATRAYIQAADANVRFRYDGTDPTAANGTQLTDAGSITLDGEDVLQHVKFIRTASTDAVLHIAYGSATSGISSDMDAV